MKYEFRDILCINNLQIWLLFSKLWQYQHIFSVYLFPDTYNKFIPQLDIIRYQSWKVVYGTFGWQFGLLNGKAQAKPLNRFNCPRCHVRHFYLNVIISIHKSLSKEKYVHEKTA
jgi:hypothetical protein